METKPLLYGLIGFILGGLIVSFAATDLQKPAGSAGSGMSEMNSSLENKSGDAFDKAFMAEMIEHHEDALHMAVLADDHARHDEVKRLAVDILTNQQKEIDQMKAWQSAWGYWSTFKESGSHHH